MEAIKEHDLKDDLRAELATLLTWQEHMLAIYSAGSSSPGYRSDAGEALDTIRLDIEELRRKIERVEYV